jgi:hypothetical protein
VRLVLFLDAGAMGAFTVAAFLAICPQPSHMYMVHGQSLLRQLQCPNTGGANRKGKKAEGRAFREGLSKFLNLECHEPKSQKRAAAD